MGDLKIQTKIFISPQQKKIVFLIHSDIANFFPCKRKKDGEREQKKSAAYARVFLNARKTYWIMVHLQQGVEQI